MFYLFGKVLNTAFWRCWVGGGGGGQNHIFQKVGRDYHRLCRVWVDRLCRVWVDRLCRVWVDCFLPHCPISFLMSLSHRRSICLYFLCPPLPSGPSPPHAHPPHCHPPPSCGRTPSKRPSYKSDWLQGHMPRLRCNVEWLQGNLLLHSCTFGSGSLPLLRDKTK